jgi:hypothetical protein
MHVLRGEREREGGGLGLLVDIEGLVEADQVRIVSCIVRFGSGCRRQLDANEGFGISHGCHRFTVRLMCYWLWRRLISETIDYA